MLIIKYCLTITRFTQAQCHKITTIAEHTILQKLGLNRRTPKIVVYETEKYGGKGLTKTYTEQIILYTEIFMAHLRG